MTFEERGKVISDLSQKSREARIATERLAKSGKDIGFVPNQDEIKTFSEYTESREKESEIQSEINQLLQVYTDNVSFAGSKTEDLTKRKKVDAIEISSE